jgi:DNA-directed RNA polymerase specialized sigma subunit
MPTKTTPWKEVRAAKLSPAVRAQLDRERERRLLNMDLRAMRKLAGKTQVAVGANLDMRQSEVSRLEQRTDHLVSTLRKYVEALGGELEIVATFGDQRVRLRSAG